MYLFVGLGNPGSTYDGTRHNAGFACLDAYLELLQKEMPDLAWKTDGKHHGMIAKTSDAILLKPTTFMNESGIAVSALASYYKVPHTQIVVVHDELAFPVGSFRLSPAGGPGGHNGILSVIAELGTENFTRLRIGIKPKTGDEMQHLPLADFVLRKPKDGEETAAFMDACARAAQTLDKLITHGIAKTMQEVNTETVG